MCPWNILVVILTHTGSAVLISRTISSFIAIKKGLVCHPHRCSCRSGQSFSVYSRVAISIDAEYGIFGRYRRFCSCLSAHFGSFNRTIRFYKRKNQSSSIRLGFVCRDISRTPRKISIQAFGYDLSIDLSIAFTSQIWISSPSWVPNWLLSGMCFLSSHSQTILPPSLKWYQTPWNMFLLLLLPSFPSILTVNTRQEALFLFRPAPLDFLSLGIFIINLQSLNGKPTLNGVQDMVSWT